MYHIRVGHEGLWTGSEIGHAVQAFTKAMIDAHQHATITIPVRLPDGSTTRRSLDLGPGSSVIGVADLGDSGSDLRDNALVLSLQKHVADQRGRSSP